MSLTECNSCSACNGKCDNCTLEVCINNMEKHREIYKLIKDFDYKTSEALQNLFDKCMEIKSNLYNNYGINIEIYNIYDTIIISEDFLNKLRIKKEEAENYIDKLKKEMENIEKEKTDNINNLNNLHQQNKKEIDKKFEEEEKKYQMNGSSNDELINSKKKIINDLIKEKDSIFIDIETIVKSFIDEERKNTEKEFDINKIEIDNNNIFIEEEFKYSEKELEKKNEYLNEINKIKKYSDKIPNYENWIMAFNLSKYLN